MKRFRVNENDQPVPFRKQRLTASDVPYSYAQRSLTRQKENLPIFQYKNHLLFLLERYKTIVVTGATGCGKSTQIPQYLVDAGWPVKGKSCIAITQPHHIAAVTVASRVSDEMSTVLGDEVGYSIRFEDCCDTSKTVVKFMTDGILLNEIMKDPLLRRYCIVILDEVHVRSINTDMCIGLLKKIQRKRPELRVIVSSATYDADKVKRFFNMGSKSDGGNAAVMHIGGERPPVDVFYTTNPVSNYVTHTAETILKIHFSQDSGDILAFLTGQEEIDEVIAHLKMNLRKMQSKKQATKMSLSILPLHSKLPMAEQQRVFEMTSKNVRKAIISTSIAETSLTIPGIVYVVDCGFTKFSVYDSQSGIDSLITCPASQASLHQRAGRCGRTRPGKVFRLFEEESLQTMPETTVPEIQRSNLVSIILRLKALGVDNILQFDYLSRPPAQLFMRGLEFLYAMNAVDKSCNLTDTYGKRMAELPLQPAYVKMLVDSKTYHCSDEIVTIVAMLMVKNINSFAANQRSKAQREQQKFAVEQGDLITLLNVYDSFVNEGNSTKTWCSNYYFSYNRMQEVVKTRRHLYRILEKLRVPVVSCKGDIDKLMRCLVSGFFTNAASLQLDGSYAGLVSGQSLAIHPSSVLVYQQQQPKWVVYTDVVRTSKLFMKNVTVIQSSMLEEIAPHFFDTDSKFQDQTHEVL